MWELELALRDLNTVIKSRDLPDGDILAESIDQMIHKTKTASELLHELDYGVGWAIDAILAEDASAVLSLEQVIDEQRSISPYHKSRDLVEQEIREIFLDMLKVVEANLQREIKTAAFTHAHIRDLDEDLLRSSNIAAKATKKTSKLNGEELAELWTEASGDASRLKNFENHNDTLKQVKLAQDEAKIRLGLISQQLQALQPPLHRLREEVTKPMLGSGWSNRPISEHVKGLKNGMEKLGQKRNEVKERKEQFQRKMREMNDRPQIFLPFPDRA